METGEQLESYLGGRVVDSQQAGHIEVVQPQLHDSEEYLPGRGANFHQIKALNACNPTPRIVAKCVVVLRSRLFSLCHSGGLGREPVSRNEVL